MRDFQIAEISSVAGRGGDGIVRGSLLQSQLDVAWSVRAFVSNATALRKDVTTGSNYESPTLSSAAGATIQPFGTAMAAGDRLYITGTQDPCEMWVEILTPGVYVGDGIEILESLNGTTLVPVEGLVDTSDGFRAAAGTTVYHISWTLKNRQAFSPEFEGTPYKYIAIRPKNLGAVTTTPILGRVWLGCAATQTTLADLTSWYNAATTDANFGTTADLLITMNTSVTWGLKGISTGLDFFIHQALEPVSTRVYEYLSSNGTWKQFSGLSDPSNGGRNGPATLGDGMQEFHVRWDIPADWVAMPQIMGGTTYTKFFVRARPSAILVYRPSKLGLFRLRSRSLGEGLSTGIRSAVAQTISAVHIEVDIPPVSDTTIAFINYVTGISRSVVFPANANSAYLPLASALVIPANGGFMISHVSGGTMRDISLHLS